MRILKSVLALGLAALVVGPAIPHASAQAPGALPPALQAAVLSGNANAVQQAITTLAGGNPQRVAELARQVVQAAERLIATNPQAAVNVASAAVSLVQNAPVSAAAPQQTLEVATIAARILINPAVQNTAPQQVAALSVSVAQVVTTPVVYQSNPAAAAQVLSNAYAATTAPVVQAANPAATGTITQVLKQASENPALASNADQIAAIVDKATTPTQQQTQLPTDRTPTRDTPDNTLTQSPS